MGLWAVSLQCERAGRDGPAQGTLAGLGLVFGIRWEVSAEPMGIFDVSQTAGSCQVGEMSCSRS